WTYLLVSRRWHTLVLNTPSMWSTIDLRGYTDPEIDLLSKNLRLHALPYLLSLRLQRSGPDHPLDI
ncbi:hypothetical protein BDV98DRAFT_561600, partial [Pterulicium gracile]